MNAVDTNVLLYSIDKHEPTKQAKAQQLMQTLRTSTEITCLPWQVLGEMGQQLRRWRDQGKFSKEEFPQHIQLYTEDMGAPRTIDDVELVNPFI